MTWACYTTEDITVGRLDRVLRFSRQFRSLRTCAHGADAFDGNSTTTYKLLLLSRFTKFTFCLDFPDKRKPKTELRSIKKVFLQKTAQKVDKTKISKRKIKE